ncbi:MAG TPA: hypothetical protein VGF06_09565 [Terriglobales bacterium]
MPWGEEVVVPVLDPLGVEGIVCAVNQAENSTSSSAAEESRISAS